MATAAALRIAESGWRRYKHTWRASVFSSFFNPIMLLLAMGIGLGELVDRNGGPGGLAYVTWLAPGLLANVAMQTAVGESAYPVQAGFRWARLYDAMVAGPVEPADVFIGHAAWVMARVAQASVAFALAAVWLADVDLIAALATIGPALLIGWAFIGPVTGYTTHWLNDTALSALFRYVVVPLFLFSGVFFPISQLPVFLQPLAWLTPLWHGVELSRLTALGIASTFAPLVHVIALVAFGFVGSWWSIGLYRKRLIK